MNGSYVEYDTMYKTALEARSRAEKMIRSEDVCEVTNTILTKFESENGFVPGFILTLRNKVMHGMVYYFVACGSGKDPVILSASYVRKVCRKNGYTVSGRYGFDNSKTLAVAMRDGSFRSAVLARGAFQ